MPYWTSEITSVKDYHRQYEYIEPPAAKCCQEHNIEIRAADWREVAGIQDEVTSFPGSTRPLIAALWLPKEWCWWYNSCWRTRASLLEGFFKQMSFYFLLKGLVILTGFYMRWKAIPQRRCHEAEGSTSVGLRISHRFYKHGRVTASQRSCSFPFSYQVWEILWCKIVDDFVCEE